MSRSTLARALLCVSIALLFTIVAAQQLQTGCTRNGQTVTCTYNAYTEASFTVPTGVTALSAISAASPMADLAASLTVTGGAGGGSGVGDQGGAAARYSNDLLLVTPGTTLRVRARSAKRAADARLRSALARTARTAITTAPSGPAVALSARAARG